MRIKTFIPLLILFMSVTTAAKNYKGAEFRTHEAFFYGRFEASYKATWGDGQLSTMFSWHDTSNFTEADWNEVDIEILGRYRNSVQFNTISPGRRNHVRTHLVDFDPAADYHTYAFEWTPDYVAWFIDGKEVYRQTDDFARTLVHGQKLMMNIWQPVWEDWVGDWDERMLPFFAYYDWASYAAYTPGSGDTGSDNNFTLLWRDEFDSWDESRWGKATHTFPGNDADFVVENVVFRDGKMILCLTGPDNPGYVDLNPPQVLWARGYPDRVEVQFSEAIDPLDAGDLSKYYITGVTINSATYLPNERRVVLQVEGLDITGTSNIIVMDGIKDRWSTPNIGAMQVIRLIMSEPLTFPVKVNLGGEVYKDYLPDTRWGKTAEYGYLDGLGIAFPAAEIELTDEDELYRTHRQHLVAYRFRVDNGRYRVILKFAEKLYSEAGRRIFDVYIEGNPVIESLDIYERAGKNRAFDLTTPEVEVDDGILELFFAARKDSAQVSAIVVEKISSGLEGSVDKSPAGFGLTQNFPNPFNTATTFSYSLPEESYVSLEIFDLKGGMVASIEKGLRQAGTHTVTWEPSSASGIYLYRLNTAAGKESHAQVKKMLLLK